MGACADPTALAVGTSSSGGLVSSHVQTYPVLARGRLALPVEASPVALLHLALDEYQHPPAGTRPTSREVPGLLG